MYFPRLEHCIAVIYFVINLVIFHKASNILKPRPVQVRRRPGRASNNQVQSNPAPSNEQATEQKTFSKEVQFNILFISFILHIWVSLYMMGLDDIGLSLYRAWVKFVLPYLNKYVQIPQDSMGYLLGDNFPFLACLILAVSSFKFRIKPPAIFFMLFMYVCFRMHEEEFIAKSALIIKQSSNLALEEMDLRYDFVEDFIINKGKKKIPNGKGHKITDQDPEKILSEENEDYKAETQEEEEESMEGWAEKPKEKRKCDDWPYAIYIPFKFISLTLEGSLGLGEIFERFVCYIFG